MSGMQEYYEAIEKNMEKLLANIGDSGSCRGCNEPIFWVTHKNGKKVPYTPEGLNHFIDCSEAAGFKKKKEQE